MWKAPEFISLSRNRLFTDGDYAIVRSAVDELPAWEQDMVRKRFWEGLSIEEIAMASDRDWGDVFHDLKLTLQRLGKRCRSTIGFSRTVL